MQKIATPGFHIRAFLPAVLICIATTVFGQQVPDLTFNTVVERPAHTRKHPTVLIDEAHANFHTAEGRYKPFADLMKSDGYLIVRGTRKFEKGSLRDVDVLVISNAGVEDAREGSTNQAFTEPECDVVRDWVSGGGALLLIADHAPFGVAAENLGRRFGVDMGNGFAFDLENSDGNPTTLVFSKENGLLGVHAILRGRDSAEQINRVLCFTGQSLGIPQGATPLLKLSLTAHEAPSRVELQAALGGQGRQPSKESLAAHAKPVPNRVQGLAMNFGKGRLVVLGEAAMLSAQIARIRVGDQDQEFKMGMNVSGSDDRQFALNVMRWLSGALK